MSIEARTASDVRDELWKDLQGRLVGDRRRVYDGFLCWGPQTTKRISDLIGMDLLTVRPRTTELLQVGLVELTGRDGHDGIYRAVKAQDALEKAVAAARPQQMLMKL